MGDIRKISEVLAAYPKQSKKLAYGTAGFRDKHDLPLDSVFVRMGMLAALRSLSVKSKCIGVMITASHNPEEDNGIKIVDYDGGMLSQSWEPYAECLANVESTDFVNKLAEIINKEGIDASLMPVVIVGRDTRYHSSRLCSCVEVGVKAIGGTCYSLGEVATPQLHYVVGKVNKTLSVPVLEFDVSFWLNDYYNAMAFGYLALKSSKTSDIKVDAIVVDTSNGVPSIELQNFSTVLNNLTPSNGLQIDIRNSNGSGKVNDGCGAELVQKNQVPPQNVSYEKDSGKLLCSFDGDGDRIVFHYFQGDTKKWILLDGDKIATLITTCIFNELVATNLNEQYTLGIVQTAYANGASTKFLKNRGIHVAIAKTGVKFVHHKALEFDIGVYFEANGHGTVLFSERIVSAITSFDVTHEVNERKKLGYQRLQACLQLINQSVGDALSDMLMCLASLEVLGMTMHDWTNLYTDFPSSQMKVKVPDKSKVTCSEDETQVLVPSILQDDLNKAMGSVTNGRCFVRPSGTEDVVRIYAEASTPEEANLLSKLTKEAIEKHLC